MQEQPGHRFVVPFPDWAGLLFGRIGLAAAEWDFALMSHCFSCSPPAFFLSRPSAVVNLSL